MNYCGIDEAGLGPILGPLSVASCSSDIQPAKLQAILARLQIWPHSARQKVKSLVPSGQPPDSLFAEKLPQVADSKLIYRGRQDFTKLEQLALSLFLTGQNRNYAEAAASWSFSALNVFSTEELQHLQKLPWYCRLCEIQLPLQASATSLQEQVLQLEAALGQQRIALRGILLPEAQYNQLISQYNNKSLVLRHLVGRLLRSYSDRLQHAKHNTEQAYCVVDRLGGLKFYGDWLRDLFAIKPSGSALFNITAESRTTRTIWSLTRLQENPEFSEYTLAWKSLTEAGEAKKWTEGQYALGFWVQGDRRHILCAIASIWAKYRRELLMQLFNSYWKSLVPGIPETSGYYRDGLHFLEYIQENLGTLPPNLRRSR